MGDVSDEVKNRAWEYLGELENSFFEVVLIPAPDPKHSGHCIRALQYANPRWYSLFCSEYTSCRGRGKKKMKRPRTFIKKEHCIKALEHLSRGKIKGIYGERLTEFINRELNREKQRKAAVSVGDNEPLIINGKHYNF